MHYWSWSRAATHLPIAEEDKQAYDSSPDHGSGCCESPAVGGVHLGYGLQLVKQDLSIKLPRDLGAKFFAGRGDHLISGC